MTFSESMRMYNHKDNQYIIDIALFVPALSREQNVCVCPRGSAAKKGGQK